MRIETHLKYILNHCFEVARSPYTTYGLSDEQLNWVKTVASDKEGFIVLLTRLVYNCFNPNQRNKPSKASVENEHYFKSFACDIIIPCLKYNDLIDDESNHEWIHDLDYSGKVGNEEVKMSLLNVLSDIETNNIEPYRYMIPLMRLAIREKEKEDLNNLKSDLTYNSVLNYLVTEFFYSLSPTEALNVLFAAILSLFEVFFKEEKNLNIYYFRAANHSDWKSSFQKEIIAFDENRICFLGRISPFIMDLKTLEGCYETIKAFGVKKFYIYVAESNFNERKEINEFIDKIEKELDCEITTKDFLTGLCFELASLWSDGKLEEYLECYRKNIRACSEPGFKMNVELI